MDRHRLRRVPRLQGVPVPRVLRGVLRARVQSAARQLVGHSPVGRAHYLSELGLPDPAPDLRRVPLRERLLTPMCRHIVYMGTPLTLEELLLAPEHSLLTQSYAPRHQSHGTVNADGFGVGWYDLQKRREPARYRTQRPMWTDQSFASIAGLITSGAVLAAVRSASPGMPVEESGTPPFAEEKWLFSHNGLVPGFHHGVGRELRRGLSERRATGIVGASDSELLFKMVLDRLDDGSLPGEALTDVVKT